MKTKEGILDDHLNLTDTKSRFWVLQAMEEYANQNNPKEEFLSDLKKGAICPTCTRFCKSYTRKLNSGMAKSLLLIYKISNKVDFGYIHVSKEFKKLGIIAIDIDYDKLKHWRLIETRPGENPSGANKSGDWKLTPLGISFAKGGSRVKESVTLLHGKIQKFSGPEIKITDAIKNKFDYFELMGFLPLNKLEGGTP